MPEPTAKDYLAFLCRLAREELRVRQVDDYNAAVKALEALVADDEARKAIDADKAKQPEKAA